MQGIHKQHHFIAPKLPNRFFRVNEIRSKNALFAVSSQTNRGRFRRDDKGGDGGGDGRGGGRGKKIWAPRIARRPYLGSIRQLIPVT